MPILSVQLQAQVKGGALLQKEGPKLPVVIRVPKQLADYLESRGEAVPEPRSGMGLIDTGATISMVDSGAIEQLGVAPIGSTMLGTAGGPTQCPLYPVGLNIGQPGAPPLAAGEFESIASGPLQAQGLIALLGRDLLQHMLLVYDGPSNRFSIAI